MSVNEAEARVKARVWQGIAQANLDLSAVPNETVEHLVQIVAESALLELDDEIGKSLDSEKLSGHYNADPGDDDEKTLWEGRPFLSLTLYYKITDERILITEGLFGKATENIELVRIQDIAHKQSFGERLINVGDITVLSHDSSHPQYHLKNVRNPKEVNEILRRAVLNARQQHNFTYREEM
jgi:hypothetical protein